MTNAPTFSHFSVPGAELVTEQAAHNLKPGDRIHFDFRGKPNHLGDVEVFDAYPVPGDVVQLVLIDADGGYHHRRVSTWITFLVR